MRKSSLAQAFPVQVKCITAVTHSFPVHAALKCKVKVDVVKDVIYNVILASDFLQKKKQVYSLISAEALPFIGLIPVTSCL
jgi:hypothetical protein